MIKLKVLALSASKKSALCAAQLTDGPFVSEVVGNVKINSEVEVGKTYDTNYKTATTRVTTTDDGVVFNWLVLGL